MNSQKLNAFSPTPHKPQIKPNPFGGDFIELKADSQIALDQKREILKSEDLTVHNVWENFLAPNLKITEPNLKKEAYQPIPETKIAEESDMFPVKGELFFNQKSQVATFFQETIENPKEAAESNNPTIFANKLSEGKLFEVTPMTVISSGVDLGKKSFKEGREVKSAIWDLLKENIFGMGAGKVKSAEQQKKEKEEKAKQMAKAGVIRSFYEKIKVAPLSLMQKFFLKGKRAEINRKINAGNELYEGYVLDSGEVRADVEALLERANSEMEKAQIKAKRESMMKKAGAGKSKKGPGVSMDLNRAAEDANNVTKLLG